MAYFYVTLTFDKDIPNFKTTIDKLKKEIYDKIFRVEWLIKGIYFSKSDISCNGDKAFIKFKSLHENSKQSLTPKITTALKGSKWSKLYLDESLKAIKLQVVVKNKPDLKFGKSKKTQKKGGGKRRVKTKKKSKAYITKEVYKAWEKALIDKYYSDEKKKTPIIPTNGNPSYLKQSKWILFLDINNIYKQASSKTVKVADLPVKQKKSIYHIGTKQLDNVSFGYDSDDEDFKYPALDLGGNTVFRSKLKTSYETKFNFKLTKDTNLKELSTKIYNEWIKLLGKSELIGVSTKDIEKWLLSVIKLLEEDDYIILRFFQLPTKHRIIITQSDIRELTGKYYERVYGLSEEEYAMDSNNKNYYTMVESHFANPNITKQNLLNEHSSYDTKKKGGGKWAFKPSDHKKKLPTSKTYKYCEKVKGTTPNKTKVCKQLCHSMSKKGYVFNKGSWLSHCKHRQWYSPDKHKYTTKELKENKERYQRSLPKTGGGKTKKMTTSEFKEFLQGKEREGWKEVRKCNKTCSTIKTNYAKNKKKLKQQRQCYGTCDKERLTNIRKIHKQYPKEFKQFIKNM